MGTGFNRRCLSNKKINSGHGSFNHEPRNYLLSKPREKRKEEAAADSIKKKKIEEKSEKKENS